MRIWGMMVVMMFLGLGSAFAVTVDLSDGRVVQGDIVKQDSKSLQVNVDGVVMTYYADEIKSIDGNPFVAQPSGTSDQATAPSSAPTEAVAPTSAAQPDVAVSAGAIDPQKKELILKFIDVFGTRQALTTNFELMIKQIEKEKPDEAKKIRERVKLDEIIDRLLPIYDRHFSAEDLKAFIAFYESADGQKLISTIPVLMKESVQESVKYMREKFPEANSGK